LLLFTKAIITKYGISFAYSLFAKQHSMKTTLPNDVFIVICLSITIVFAVMLVNNLIKRFSR